MKDVSRKLLLALLGILVLPPLADAADQQGASYLDDYWRYDVATEAYEQSYVVRVRVGTELHAQLMLQGYQGMQGEDAVLSYVQGKVKEAVEQGRLDPASGEALVLRDVSTPTIMMPCEKCWTVTECYPDIGCETYERCICSCPSVCY